MTLLDRLIKEKDDKYRGFQVKLVPNIPPETILGVRTPQLRKIAGEVFDSGNKEKFLNDLPHRWYEENLIHFFVLAKIRDFDQCVQAVELFLPYVNCWPVSDQATPKSFSKNHQKLLPYVIKWIQSDHVYTARFGLRMLMNEFLDEDFKVEYLDLAASAKGDDYYLKMMVAWYFATALAKRYDETVPFFENRRLNVWVHKKAIQKAAESYRITNERKEYLKSLRYDFRICKVNKDTELANMLLAFVKECTWTEVKEHIADMLHSWKFTEWETMFAALIDGNIVGMASVMKTDYYPLPETYPWISCIYVSDEYRGRKISGELIEYANNYLKNKGFTNSYIPSEFFGLYEQYGYTYVKDIENYGGGTDHLFMKKI